LVLLRPGITTPEPAMYVAIMAAVFLSGFILITKKIGENEPLLPMVLFPIFSDISILLPIMVYLGGWHPPQIEHFVIFALAGAFYLIGTTCSAKGFASGDTTLLAPFQYSQIIWGTLIGFFFFKETLDLWTGLGAGIIVASGIYIVHREHKAHQHAESEENGTTH